MFRCPTCGEALELLRELTELWIELYRCPGCDRELLYVADSRFRYPLQPLSKDDARMIASIPIGQLATHVRYIHQRDYETLDLTVFLEKLRSGKTNRG